MPGAASHPSRNEDSSRMPSPRSAAARAVAVCALAAIAASACAGQAPAGSAGSEARIPVTVTAEGCQPSSLNASAGRVVFEVTNGGADAGEFEVLSGTRVVDEVENIVPGFVVNFATRLDGGTYDLICYSLQAPRGTLAVSGGAAPSIASAVVDAATLANYQDEYETYVRGQTDELVTELAPFVAAVKAGDLDAAK